MTCRPSGPHELVTLRNPDLTVGAIACRPLRACRCVAIIKAMSAFPHELESFIEREVSSGAYASREELIVVAVALLRQHQADLARLCTEIAEGMPGEGIPSDEVFGRLRTMYNRGEDALEFYPEFEAELLRRLAEMDSGRAKMLSLDEVMRLVRKKLNTGAMQ
jgi:Arc/MetJ-type ribon-helix-helix transcriptional regulator